MDSFFKNPNPLFFDNLSDLEYSKRIRKAENEVLLRIKKEDEVKLLEYIGSITSRNKPAKHLATDYKGDGTKPSPPFSWRGKLE